ncbi:MAG: hypothetical protein QXK74_07800 [Candidatus Nitrosocaldaceae archaeon]
MDEMTNSLRVLLKTVIAERFKMIIVITIAYSIAYIFIVGIVSYYPTVDLAKIFPIIPTIRFTNIGIIAALSNHVYFFAFYHAIAFIIITAFLVGLNVALLIHGRRVRCCSINMTNRTFLSFIPAFFTSFACCSGGILVYAIGSLAFSYLAVYSIQFASITIALLIASLYLTAKNIVNTSINRRHKVV